MLRPVKAEMVWRRPRLLIFRDLLSTAEANRIKEVATPRVCWIINLVPMPYLAPFKEGKQTRERLGMRLEKYSHICVSEQWNWRHVVSNLVSLFQGRSVIWGEARKTAREKSKKARHPHLHLSEILWKLASYLENST